MRHADHPIYHVYIYRLDHRVKRRRAPRRSPSNPLAFPSRTTTSEYSSADMGANEPITRNRAAAFHEEGKTSRFSSFPFKNLRRHIRVTPSIMATVLCILIGASESTLPLLFIYIQITNVCHSKRGFEISSTDLVLYFTMIFVEFGSFPLLSN